MEVWYVVYMRILFLVAVECLSVLYMCVCVCVYVCVWVCVCVWMLSMCSTICLNIWILPQLERKSIYMYMYNHVYAHTSTIHVYKCIYMYVILFVSTLCTCIYMYMYNMQCRRRLCNHLWNQKHLRETIKWVFVWSWSISAFLKTGYIYMYTVYTTCTVPVYSLTITSPALVRVCCMQDEARRTQGDTSTFIVHVHV